MLVLIGCEESQTICKEFRALGIEAYSCDLLPCSGGHPEWHLQMDVFEAIKLKKWDLGIFHPPCIFLSVSGARWLYNKDGSINEERRKNQEESLDFVRRLMAADIPHIAIENPISVISSRIRKPDQIINPWQFGHLENKKTCLWLKNLPLLKPTDNVKVKMIGLPKKETDKIHYASPGADRSRLRSITYRGIAKAIAQQWSEFIKSTQSSESARNQSV